MLTLTTGCGKHAEEPPKTESGIEVNKTEEELREREREHQEDLARLRGFRPIDDTFMRCLFRDKLLLS